MYIDKFATLATDQAVTASAATTDYMNLDVARDIGMSSEKLMMCITCTETATSGGSSTVVFSLQTDDNSGFSSAVDRIASAAIPKATLVAGYQLFLPIPPGTNEKFLRGYHTVAVSNLTAGKFTWQLVDGIQKSTAYPDAI